MESKDKIPLSLGETRIPSPAQACLTLEQAGDEEKLLHSDPDRLWGEACEERAPGEEAASSSFPPKPFGSRLPKQCQAPVTFQPPRCAPKIYSGKKSSFFVRESCSFLPGEPPAVTHPFSIPVSRIPQAGQWLRGSGRIHELSELG